MICARPDRRADFGADPGAGRGLTRRCSRRAAGSIRLRARHRCRTIWYTTPAGLQPAAALGRWADSHEAVDGMRRWALVVTLALGALAACRPAAQRAAGQPSSAAAAGPGARFGPACAAAIARARANPADAAIAPARPLSALMPPFPPAGAARPVRLAVRFALDSAGGHDPAALAVEGAPSTAYAAEVRRTFARARFRPALLDGCGVPAPAALTYEIR